MLDSNWWRAGQHFLCYVLPVNISCECCPQNTSPRSKCKQPDVQLHLYLNTDETKHLRKSSNVYIVFLSLFPLKQHFSY